MGFIIMNILYILLPFGFAAVHNKVNRHNVPFLRLCFVYFLLIDVFLKGIPIGATAIIQGEAMAAENNWGFSPIYAEYGIAVATMGLMGLIAVFIHGSFRVAVALSFALFLLFSAISHIIQAAHGVSFVSHNIVVLIIFDFITAIILLYFCTNEKAWR